jgi:isoamylase
MNNKTLLAGKSHPLGASVRRDGVNFSLYSRNAASLDLLLFENPDDDSPSDVISFDRYRNRVGHYWNAFIPGLKPGQLYAYRVDGPFDPKQGHRFDSQKVLIDPYGLAVAVPSAYNRQAAARPGDNTSVAMKSVIVDRRGYNWEGDVPINRPFSRTVIYEMHVGGFTKHPNSGVSEEKRGTFAGMIEKIPYLQDLGVTTVELLPIFQFDIQEAPARLTNYWGYNPVSFFAPHCGYSSSREPLGPLNEFRELVKALHKAGIEIILDVVYNHTAEGGQFGPTYCFKGLENSLYYILDEDKSHYANFSGTGNTLNTNNAIVRRLILDSLHYWVQDMHVDGFRFDLASILSRDESGAPLKNPPLLWDIDTDPVLAGTKLIAEAWDAAGLYQVGSFIGDNWKEWNGRFRDDVRAFFRSDPGMTPKLANRMLASPDIYSHEQQAPEQSINFVTCHDGFTLNDLVSYDQKHNQANGENNQDGWDNNLSWNCGVEGPSDDPEIESLRLRQIKNFFATTLMALGVPMLLMGDEVRRTQHGNNNAYCQDNETSWFDWSLVDRNHDLMTFVGCLIRLRLKLDIFQRTRDLTLTEYLKEADIQWHGVKLDQPDWSYESHSLAFFVYGRRELLHVILNAYKEPLEFELARWQRLIDTSLEVQQDFCDPSRAPIIDSQTYLAQSHSVVVLMAESAGNRLFAPNSKIIPDNP